MPILIQNIKAPLHDADEYAIQYALTLLGRFKKQVCQLSIYKKSLDARNKQKIGFVMSVQVMVSGDEKKICKLLHHQNVIFKADESLVFDCGTKKLRTPIYIVGFGPAGIFCAYALASQGYCPIVIERGENVDSRSKTIKQFWNYGILQPNSNVQFGEGGAGTFSDGKLTTRIGDPRCRYVLEILHRFGAPQEILWLAKPHIGTDYLRPIIKKIRQEIIRLGGQIWFNRTLEHIYKKNGALTSIMVNGITLKSDILVLATGHSARDTFSMLVNQGVPMQSKDFSVGVRIEHLQEHIDHGLYGKKASDPAIPTGEYQLSLREEGRGIYTFCMCPGGSVVPSSSEEFGVVTNGMSHHARNEKNANSALVVSVSSKDYGTDILDGMRFQQRLEQQAFRLGHQTYAAPGSTVGAFLEGKAGFKWGEVKPSYALGVVPCNLTSLFGESISRLLQVGIRYFDKRINGFAASDSVLTGVETRTSSPVRILRNDALVSPEIKGLYPCGEGAGYAGGIMSAAVDGIRVAQQLIQSYAPDVPEF